VGQTAAAVERAAARTGAAVSPQAGGEAGVRGVRRFVGVSFDDIAVPDDAIETIIRTPSRNVRAEAGEGFLLKSRALYQRIDSFFEATDQVPVENAMAALSGSSAKFVLAELGKQFVSPRFAKWTKIIEENSGGLTYNDLRLFRTEVGRLLRSPQRIMAESLDTRRSSNYTARFLPIWFRLPLPRAMTRCARSGKRTSYTRRARTGCAVP